MSRTIWFWWRKQFPCCTRGNFTKKIQPNSDSCQCELQVHDCLDNKSWKLLGHGLSIFLQHSSSPRVLLSKHKSAWCSVNHLGKQTILEYWPALVSMKRHQQGYLLIVFAVMLNNTLALLTFPDMFWSASTLSAKNCLSGICGLVDTWLESFWMWEFVILCSKTTHRQIYSQS